MPIVIQNHLLVLHCSPSHDDKQLTSTLFWKVCQLTWRLHKLSRAYCVEPEIVRVAPGALAVERYSNMSRWQTGEDDDSGCGTPARGTVACTVMPGFELDGKVCSCDVLVLLGAM